MQKKKTQIKLGDMVVKYFHSNGKRTSVIGIVTDIKSCVDKIDGSEKKRFSVEWFVGEGQDYYNYFSPPVWKVPESFVVRWRINFLKE